MQGAMAGMLGAAAAGRRGGQAQRTRPMPAVPEIDGMFRIVTDGDILANNTDEGPQAGAGGKVAAHGASAADHGGADGAGKLAP